MRLSFHFSLAISTQAVGATDIRKKQSDSGTIMQANLPSITVTIKINYSFQMEPPLGRKRWKKRQNRIRAKNIFQRQITRKAVHSVPVPLLWGGPIDRSKSAFFHQWAAPPDKAAAVPLKLLVHPPSPSPQ